MKVALCCIGRMENRYVKEYVLHYKGIGVDKMFIYDNNYDGEEHFEDVIGEYVEEGFVEIIDYRNKTHCQLESYQDCYDKHKEEYDWILFIDCGDEYLYMNEFNNIKDFLSQDKFNGYDVIHINLMNYGDNGLVKYDERPLCKRFTYPIMPLDFKKTYDFPENDHISSIVRGNLEKVEWKRTPHTPSNELKCCDASGNEQQSTSPFIHPFDFSYAHFKHYTTKTIQEWCEVKTKRGFPDGNKDYFKKHNRFDEFFKWNKKTDEKMKYIESLGVPNESNEPNNVDIFICTYKSFEPKVSNNVYKVLDARPIEAKDDSPLNSAFYSELYLYFYIAEHYALKDYVGFCHYRKYWKFLDEVPNMEQVINDHEILVAKPITFKRTVKEQYALFHNIEDLYIIGGILADKYPNYAVPWHSFLDGKTFFPYNMFVMKKEEFYKYVEFVKDVLDEFIKIIGTDIYKRIDDNKEKYIKDFHPNDKAWYQYRIGGYIAERLTNVWILANHNKVGVYDVVVTENKYGKEEVENEEKQD